MSDSQNDPDERPQQDDEPHDAPENEDDPMEDIEKLREIIDELSSKVEDVDRKVNASDKKLKEILSLCEKLNDVPSASQPQPKSVKDHGKAVAQPKNKVNKPKAKKPAQKKSTSQSKPCYYCKTGAGTARCITKGCGSAMHVSGSPDCAKYRKDKGITRNDIPGDIGANTNNWTCPDCVGKEKPPTAKKKAARRNETDARNDAEDDEEMDGAEDINEAQDINGEDEVDGDDDLEEEAEE